MYVVLHAMQLQYLFKQIFCSLLRGELIEYYLWLIGVVALFCLAISGVKFFYSFCCEFCCLATEACSRSNGSSELHSRAERELLELCCGFIFETAKKPGSLICSYSFQNNEQCSSRQQ